MKEARLIERVVERTGLARADVVAVMDALREAAEDGADAAADGGSAHATHGHAHHHAYRPKDHEVEALIAAAEKHPLGTEFLIEGHLGTVAITFKAHAFTVEAARHRLRGPAPKHT
jgi:hypothetical protein